jgi:outer membrane immunogenic protein
MFPQIPASLTRQGHSMKKLALTVSIIAFSSAGAFAADLPAKVYTKAPVIADPVYDWTGFYVGGNVGYSWGRSSSLIPFSDPSTSTLLAATSSKFDMDGVIGGGQLGYNWQINRWVFGLEADIQGSGQKGSTNALCAGGPTTFTSTLPSAVNGLCSLGRTGDTVIGDVGAFPVTESLSQKLEWFGTVRGRIGPTITPTILAYVTGGLAYGEVRTTDTVGGTNILGPQGVNSPAVLAPVTGSFSNSSTRVGWTVGAGVEGAIGGNWTAKLEYLYIDLGNVSGSFVTPIVTPSGGFLTTGYNSHITDNILRVGVNYRFAGPVVARY